MEYVSLNEISQVERRKESGTKISGADRGRVTEKTWEKPEC